MIYLDTSVLVAYYCPEPLSDRAEKIVREQAQPAVSQLSEVEFASAVARKRRGRLMSAEDAGRVLAQFAGHLETGFYTRLVLDSHHFLIARDWIAGFTTPLRTLDALHLAVAVTSSLQLVTADQELADSARLLGTPFLLISGERPSRPQ